MIVISDKGKGSDDCMLPVHVVAGKGRTMMMESITVEEVGQNLIPRSIR